MEYPHLDSWDEIWDIYICMYIYNMMDYKPWIRFVCQKKQQGTHCWFRVSPQWAGDGWPGATSGRCQFFHWQPTLLIHHDVISSSSSVLLSWLVIIIKYSYIYSYHDSPHTKCQHANTSESPIDDPLPSGPLGPSTFPRRAQDRCYSEASSMPPSAVDKEISWQSQYVSRKVKWSCRSKYLLSLLVLSWFVNDIRKPI